MSQRILILILVVIWVLIVLREKFGATSRGTLIQLVAKGPQDYYLTGPWWWPWRYW